MDLNWKCGQSDVRQPPLPPLPPPDTPPPSDPPDTSHHLIQLLPCFKIMLPSRVQLSLSGCLWVFFFSFSLCTDKRKITQDCPHTIEGAINAFILFFHFSSYTFVPYANVKYMQVTGSNLFPSSCPFFSPSLSLFPPLSLFVSPSLPLTTLTHSANMR